MKLIKLYVLLFLILSSSVIQTAEKIKSNKHKFMRRGLTGKTKKFTMKGCTGFKFSILYFVIGLTNTLNDGMAEEITSAVSEVILQKTLPDPKADKCLKDIDEVIEGKVKEAEKEIEKISNKPDDNIQKLSAVVDLSKYTDLALNDVKNDPQKLCKKISKIATYHLEISKEKDNCERYIKKSVAFLKDPFVMGQTLAQFDEWSNCIMTCESREYLSSHLEAAQKKSPTTPFDKIKQQALIDLEKQYQVCSPKIQALKKIEGQNCSILPGELDHQKKCYQAGIAVKAKLFFDIIKNPPTDLIKNCIGVLFKGFVLQKLMNAAVEKVINVILNFFSAFVLSIIKTIYYAITLIYKIVQVFNAKSDDERSELMGECMGREINLILSIAQIRKRKI